MDTLKDLWASLVAGIRERTTNPLTVALIVSWCLWNYKFFVVLFGDGTTAERLQAIEAMYPHVAETYWGEALFYPILSAAVYVVIYPFIGMGAIWIYRKYQVATTNLIKQVEKARTITPQERDALIRAHEKERKKLTDEAEVLFTQLTAVRAALATAEEQLEKVSSKQPSSEAQEVRSGGTIAAASLEKKNQDSRSQSDGSDAGEMTAQLGLDEDKVNILLHLSNYSNSVPLDIIANNMGLNPTLTNRALRELEKIELIDQNSSGHWHLTEKGEDFVVTLLKKKR